jgi:hypothetical protein
MSVLLLQVDIHSVEQGPNSHMSLGFSEPRPWRAEFTKQLDDAGRFQPVTLPELLRAGATQFCWLSPGARMMREGRARKVFVPGSSCLQAFEHNAFLSQARC